MTRSKIYLLVALMAVAVSFALVSSQGEAQGLTDVALGKATAADPAYVVGQIYPFQTVSYTASTASTTAVAVTALSGRVRVRIAPSDSTKQLKIAIGTSTVASLTGIVSTYDAPFIADLDDDISIYTIASEAFPFSILQLKY
ncbi:MAG: hypothetical protein RLZZ524_1872 [Pseudomonadota bacterium]